MKPDAQGRSAVGLLLLIGAFAASTKPVTEKNYRVFHGDGSPASLDEILQRAQKSNVTFLGESHDDAVAHYLEAEILKHVAGPDWALSLEMFDRDVQPVLDEYLSGAIEDRDLIDSGRAWGNYRTDYGPLVDIARQHHMPVIAANAPKRYVNLVGKKGQQALLTLSAEAKRNLPPLPYAQPSQAYRERFRREMGEEMSDTHGDQHESVAAHHVSDYALEAQSLWDAAMADSLAKFLNANPDKHVLQINGAFHSEYHQGIVERLEAYRPGTSSVVVTILRDKSFPRWNDTAMKGAGDFVIVTDPHVKPQSIKR